MKLNPFRKWWNRDAWDNRLNDTPVPAAEPAKKPVDEFDPFGDFQTAPVKADTKPVHDPFAGIDLTGGNKSETQKASDDFFAQF